MREENAGAQDPSAQQGQGQPQQAQTAAPQPQVAPAGPGVIPAGTRMQVRLDETLDSASMSPGQRFTATLEANLADSTGAVIVPMGTKIFGTMSKVEQAGRLAGQSELEVIFTDFRLDGQLYPIQSQGVKAAGEKQGKDTARKVGIGALVGAAAGGGEGAAIGAAVGGAAALATKGGRVQIPAKTLLELQLRAPFSRPGGATPAPTAAPTAAPTTTAAPPASAAPAGSAKPDQKDCIKRLMDKGFGAEEAIKTCGG
jgi:hypothetical protein